MLSDPSEGAASLAAVEPGVDDERHCLHCASGGSALPGSSRPMGPFVLESRKPDRKLHQRDPRECGGMGGVAPPMRCAAGRFHRESDDGRGNDGEGWLARALLRTRRAARMLFFSAMLFAMAGPADAGDGGMEKLITREDFARLFVDTVFPKDPRTDRTLRQWTGDIRIGIQVRTTVDDEILNYIDSAISEMSRVFPYDISIVDDKTKIDDVNTPIKTNIAIAFVDSDESPFANALHWRNVKESTEAKGASFGLERLEVIGDIWSKDPHCFLSEVITKGEIVGAAMVLSNSPDDIDIVKECLQDYFLKILGLLGNNRSVVSKPDGHFHISLVDSLMLKYLYSERLPHGSTVDATRGAILRDDDISAVLWYWYGADEPLTREEFAQYFVDSIFRVESPTLRRWTPTLRRWTRNIRIRVEGTAHERLLNYIDNAVLEISSVIPYDISLEYDSADILILFTDDAVRDVRGKFKNLVEKFLPPGKSLERVIEDHALEDHLSKSPGCWLLPGGNEKEMIISIIILSNDRSDMNYMKRCLKDSLLTTMGLFGNNFSTVSESHDWIRMSTLDKSVLEYLYSDKIPAGATEAVSFEIVSQDSDIDTVPVRGSVTKELLPITREEFARVFIDSVVISKDSIIAGDIKVSGRLRRWTRDIRVAVGGTFDERLWDYIRSAVSEISNVFPYDISFKDSGNVDMTILPPMTSNGTLLENSRV